MWKNDEKMGHLRIKNKENKEQHRMRFLIVCFYLIFFRYSLFKHHYRILSEIYISVMVCDYVSFMYLVNYKLLLPNMLQRIVDYLINKWFIHNV